jgi:PPOX class probable F420-dependent enzyme
MLPNDAADGGPQQPRRNKPAEKQEEEGTAYGRCWPGMSEETIDPAHRTFLARHKRAALVTIRRNGRPQLSNVLYDHDAGTDTARISVTEDLAKTHNARRDPWVALHASSRDFWSYVVAEGEATLSPVAADPHDEVVEQLVSYYRNLSGEHPDWEEYRAAQVAERRLVLTVTVERTYGLVR